MKTSTELPYLTESMPGIGGTIRNKLEDFKVEEDPAYDPTGNGDHLYLFVHKEAKNTSEVVRVFAEHFHVEAKDIGYAGMKDKWAVTRQAFTVPGASMEDADRFEHDQIKILWCDYHKNKMKPGHLKGNQFELVIRDVDPLSVLRAKKILDVLESKGAPNYYGPQRFGYRGDNAYLGARLLKQDWREFLDMFLGSPRTFESEAVQAARTFYHERNYKAAIEAWPKSHRFERQVVGALSRGKGNRDAVMSMDRTQLNFLISAWQSEQFNEALAERVKEGTMDKVCVGDIAEKVESGGKFWIEDASIEQPRVDSFEISPTGPIYGAEMRQARADVLDRESTILGTSGVALADFSQGRFKPKGSRRTYRMKVMYPEISSEMDEKEGALIRLSFFLPAGGYATTVLREIMKNEMCEGPTPEAE